ncbi:MAG: hypothetical protein LQ344_003110 [Seirophora lacunosa]|nr:MAG: hypothetical protein LQ344_003110 [Seirophora lacunosa]
MSSSTDLRSRRRGDYPFHLTYRTRWSDNDMYAHLNNSVYGHLFDSIINAYLITRCGLHPPTSPRIFLAVSTTAAFFAPVAFPAVVDLGLRVTKLGTSSVTYEVGVFEEGADEVRCVGGFVHVCVEKGTRRTAEGGMGDGVREGLRPLLVVAKGGKRAKL